MTVVTATQTDNKIRPGSENFSFVEAEHAILDFWEKSGVFQKSLQQTSNSTPYIFYDGPPFATGLPHHGNLVGSILKDIVPRYFTMKGFHVERRFGWDCHGLPVEYEIDKALGMSSREAVSRLGIKGYNDECRKIVQRYTAEWEKTITRVGRWVDFKNDYKTMDPWYMESLWWVVRQLWEKDLIYRGFKVVPFSTALSTVLSNFEATSNYQDVQDPSITVLFKLKDKDTYISAWTTTPWTLPSNLALCVGREIEYVKVHDPDLDKQIIVARDRLMDVIKGNPPVILESMLGSDLVGLSYEPLFPYFAELESEGAFRIVSDDYVSTETGTGIVHQAPAFGEDDFRILKDHDIQALVCPVDMEGRFTEEVTDFAGQYVKDADSHIIRKLKEQGNLYHQDVIEHSYPFCWRSDTPVIYRTIDSWYVRVEQMRDQLLAVNQKINWIPGHIKTGRMGNWLSGAIDWAISRNRYWGTPLPIWINDATGRQICIGSREELYRYTGVHVDDLHRENVDPLTFTIDGETGTYRRVEEVLDCWFESGSMPYAQLNYPFQNQDVFEQGFPAEYIAEGLDQTRGWFYTLIVLSTALFGVNPFKNVIVNGIVAAEDGKKMSKSLRNYTPPDELMEAYGADALRLYLINSGLVRAEDQRFKDAGVRDMVRRVLLPWLNAFRFFNTYTVIDNWQPDSSLSGSGNIMDKWILSRLQSLKATIAEEMEAYRLYNVTPLLFDFIGDLTNWYIRLNRPRMWVEGDSNDKSRAYQALFTTVYELSLSMAPFAPFLAESIYRELPLAENAPESIHLCQYPVAEKELIEPKLEQAVARMQQVILLGRHKRNQEKIKIRYPLHELTIIHKDRELLDEIARLEDYIKSELNVKTVTYSTDEGRFVDLYAKANAPVLGKRLGKRFKHFQQRIEKLTSEDINQLQDPGEIVIEGETFTGDDILIFREPMAGTGTLSNRFVSISMDCVLTPELIGEGLAREVINRIQNTRRDSGFNITDRIRLDINASTGIREAIAQHQQHIMQETLALEMNLVETSLPISCEINEHLIQLDMSVIKEAHES